MSVCPSEGGHMAPIWRIFMTLYVGGILLTLGLQSVETGQQKQATRVTISRLSRDPFRGHSKHKMAPHEGHSCALWWGQDHSRGVWHSSLCASF